MSYLDYESDEYIIGGENRVEEYFNRYGDALREFDPIAFELGRADYEREKNYAKGGELLDGGMVNNNEEYFSYFEYVAKDDYLQDTIYDVKIGINKDEEFGGELVADYDEITINDIKEMFGNQIAQRVANGYGRDYVDVDYRSKVIFVNDGLYKKGGKFADKKIVQLEDGKYYEETTVNRRNEDGISEPYVYYQEIEEKSKGGKFADGGEVIKGFNPKDFSLQEIDSKLLSKGISLQWLREGDSTYSADKRDVVWSARQSSTKWNAIKNKRFTMSDYGQVSMDKGSENLYFTVIIYELDGYDPMELQMYSKDNHSDLKSFANSFISKMAKGGRTTRAINQDRARLSKEKHEQAYLPKRKGDYSSFEMGGDISNSQKEENVGQEIADFLYLKKKRPNSLNNFPHYETTEGTKTDIGLFNTMHRIIEDYSNDAENGGKYIAEVFKLKKKRPNSLSNFPHYETSYGTKTDTGLYHSLNRILEENSFKKGGKTMIDEEFSNVPEELEEVFGMYNEDEETYSEMKRLKAIANQRGYDFDYGLDGEPTEFWEINKMAKGGTVKRYIVHKGDGYDGEVVGSSDTFRGASMIEKRLEKKGVFNDVDSYGINDTENYYYTRKDNKYDKGGEVKDEYKDFFKRYEENEENNYHTENAIMLVSEFGTADELKRLMEIQKMHENQGYLTVEQSREQYEIQKPYYRQMFAKGEEIVEDSDGNKYEIIEDFSDFKLGELGYNPMSGVVMPTDEEDIEMANENWMKVKKGSYYAKGGKTWVQDVVDSPNFREGAFTRKAEARGMSTDAFMNQVLHSPNLYDERTRKQAQFMKNAFND